MIFFERLNVNGDRIWFLTLIVEPSLLTNFPLDWSRELFSVVFWRIWWRNLIRWSVYKWTCLKFRTSKCCVSMLISPLIFFSQYFRSTSQLTIFNVRAGEIEIPKEKFLNLVVWILFIGGMEKITSSFPLWSFQLGLILKRTWIWFQADNICQNSDLMGIRTWVPIDTHVSVTRCQLASVS